jgi:SAM-dependent methyltransferase
MNDRATIARRGEPGDPVYWLERSDEETRRLVLQARLLDPITEWVTRNAGISGGMRVLDVGSEPGDVALLVARLVGPHGAVVGVDSDPRILDVARARAEAAGLGNVEFVAGDCRSADVGEGFDALVGRLILLYLQDPAEAVRSLVERLKPGGVVLFQEYNITSDSVRTCPRMPTWERQQSWVTAAARRAGLDEKQGFRLFRTFITAGLPPPEMRLDSEVGGGPDWIGYEYLAETVRSMLPLILATGVASAEQIDIDTLTDRLRAETVAHGGVVKAPDLVSAWSRKG